MRDSAFAMLTTEPGKDIKPYHDRQIVVVRKARWADWLLGRVAEAEVLKPCPAGSLQVKLVQTP